MSDIYVSVALSTPDGALELNSAPYRVGDGSFEESAVTLRKQTVQSPFLEGEFVVNALRGNSTESLNVWVSESSAFALQASLDVLKDALRQPQFTLVRTVQNARTTFYCYASDYSVTTQRALLHANRAQLRTQITREPVYDLAEL